MKNRTTKVFSHAPKTPSFYLIQTNFNKKRYVISVSDKTTLKFIISDFINRSEQDIALKIRETNASTQAVEHQGSIEKEKLHEFMSVYDNIIFQNGNHELLLKNVVTDEVLVFDDQGLVFLYTEADYSSLFKQFHIKYSPTDTLIYEHDHWKNAHNKEDEKLYELLTGLQ